MNKQRTELLRKHRFTAPFFVAILFGIVLYKFFGLSARMSAIIAIALGVTDFIGLTLMLNKLDKPDA